MVKTETDPVLTEAWAYVHRWAARTMSDRVKRIPDEDALVVAAGFLAVDKTPSRDGGVGKVCFDALGDNVEVELYDPRRMLHGVVPRRHNDMPMQGQLSTRRSFENDRSITHIGVDGELYRQGAEAHLVSANPMDLISKLATLTYFEARVNAVVLIRNS